MPKRVRRPLDFAKELWYDGGYPEEWTRLDWTSIENETVPVTESSDKPKLLGGPE